MTASALPVGIAIAEETQTPGTVKVTVPPVRAALLLVLVTVACRVAVAAPAAMPTFATCRLVDALVIVRLATLGELVLALKFASPL